MAEDYDPSLDIDPAMLTPSDVLLAQAAARQAQLRGTPPPRPAPAPQPQPVVTRPQPQPQPPREPQPGESAYTLRLLSDRMNQRPDERALVEYARARAADADEKFRLGMVMQAMGGSAFS